MGIQEIRRWAPWLAAGLALLFIVYFITTRNTGGAFGEIQYTDSFSGKSETYLSKKALEAGASGVQLVNATALDPMGSDRADYISTTLRQFVSMQSHYYARKPVIADVQKIDDANWRLRLLIDSSEQVYDVRVSFSQNSRPALTFTEVSDAKI